jgi:hypothetical protein
MIFELISILNNYCLSKNVIVSKVTVYPKTNTFLIDIEKGKKDAVISWSNFNRQITIRVYGSTEANICVSESNPDFNEVERFVNDYLTTMEFL